MEQQLDGIDALSEGQKALYTKDEESGKYNLDPVKMAEALEKETKKHGIEKEHRKNAEATLAAKEASQQKAIEDAEAVARTKALEEATKAGNHDEATKLRQEEFEAMKLKLTGETEVYRKKVSELTEGAKWEELLAGTTNSSYVRYELENKYGITIKHEITSGEYKLYKNGVEAANQDIMSTIKENVIDNAHFKDFVKEPTGQGGGAKEPGGRSGTHGNEEGSILSEHNEAWGVTDK